MEDGIADPVSSIPPGTYAGTPDGLPATALTVKAPSFASGAALQAALNAASAAGGSTVRVGDTNIGATVVTVPTNVDIHCLGKITTSGNGGLLFDGHSHRRHRVWVERNAYDWPSGADSTSIGIQVRNCSWTTFDIVDVRAYMYGLYLLGDGTGCANNTFTLGIVIDNKVNIQPAILNSGWVNQNTVVGGQVRHSSGFTGQDRAITNVAVTANVATITTSTPHSLTIIEGRTVTIAGLTNSVLNGTWTPVSVPTSTTFTFAVTTANIASTADTGTVSNLPSPGSRGVAACLGGNGFNNNQFSNTNFEGQLTERTVDLNGPFNQFLACRWEQAVGLWMTSIATYTQIIGGYHADVISITDASDTYTVFANGCVRLGGTGAVHLGGSARLASASGGAKIDSLGPVGREYRFVRNNNITGSGIQTGTVQAQTALELGTTAGETTLTRAAAGVAAQGAGNVFKTGHAVTGSRPAAATVGKGSQFYDDTLSKPIWSDGTNWKDAAGNTV